VVHDGVGKESDVSCWPEVVCDGLGWIFNKEAWPLIKSVGRGSRLVVRDGLMLAELILCWFIVVQAGQRLFSQKIL
jgi:hypothetical protein